jgi:hypothetical protein
MRTITSALFFLILGACVDRLTYNIPKSSSYGIVVNGFISDQPGPYTVKISKAFDIESKESTKTPVSVKHLILSDNEGDSEELAEVVPGTYTTKSTGIQGKGGNSYTLRMELLDGKIYESLPDTLLASGKMDSLYYSFTGIADLNGSREFGFDIYTNSSSGNSSSGRFIWNMIGTFKSDTHPELIPRDKSQCFPIGAGKCNYLPPCTGLLNKAFSAFELPDYIRVAPCECCTCWYKIYNAKPILSDDYFSTSQNFEGIKVYRVPLSPWIFMYKIHVEVRQLSLTKRSFRFFKAIRDQQSAVNSLFQPVSGKIPVNFIQLNGEEEPVQGLFYAAAISSKSLYLTRDEVPDLSLIPSLEAPGIGWISCLELFPNATNIKPAFWVD